MSVLRWLAGLLGLLVLAGLELATEHRATNPAGQGIFSAQGAWFGLWLVGGGLGIAGLATPVAGLLRDEMRLPLKPALVLVGLATVLAVALQGVGTGILAVPLLAVGAGSALEDEQPGWGGLAAAVFASCPGVLLGANEPWMLATALGALAMAHPAGLPLSIVAGLLDPVVGIGLTGAWLAAGRGRVALLPGIASLWPLYQQLDVSDPLLAPALGLLAAALALGWPFGLLGILGASPRWLGMAIGMGFTTAWVGPSHAYPLILPLTAGCILGSLEQLGSRRALAMWVAAVVAVSIGYFPRVVQLPTPGSLPTVEER